MKLILRHISIVLVIVMFFLGFCVPCFIDKPQKIYKLNAYESSIRTSGLSPKGDVLLRGLIVVVIVSIAVSFFYLRKMEKIFTCEKDFFSFRCYWRIWRYLLFVAILLATAQITFAFWGLFVIEHITLVYIFHSRLFDAFTVLFVFISFFLFTNDYINRIQKTKPSDFINWSSEI